MYEIEAKVPLSRADFLRLKKTLPLLAAKRGSIHKTDVYYACGKAMSMRLRETNKSAVLTIKNKNRGRGIEANQEIEIPLKSGPVFKKWLKKQEIIPVARKKKHSEIYRNGPWTFELNRVENLGYFLEIEILTHHKKEVSAGKRQLKAWFKKLGFAPHQFENRYYLDLLSEKH